MNSSTSDSAALQCDYCGSENPRRLIFCSGCGTRLAEEPVPETPVDSKPKPKSKFLAVCLALLFGPLGLLYVGAARPMIALLVTWVLVLLTHRGIIWVSIGLRIFSAGFAYAAVIERDGAPNLRRDSNRYLIQAARLETTDLPKAIAAYEDIIRLYPGTPAAKEAQRNLELIKRRA